MSHTCTRAYEDYARDQGAQFVAGLDEAGRGSLFGPVVAAAVVLDPEYPIEGLNDSKQLTAKRREALDKVIRESAWAWAIAEADAARVDAWNILEATKQAMLTAINSIRDMTKDAVTLPIITHTPATIPDFLLIDAVKLDTSIPQLSIIHGDSLSISIAAASILAKVHRDRLMGEWANVYSQYKLEKNKGYPTVEHISALCLYGPTPHHRQSFKPVRTQPQPQQALLFP